jgi:poly(ADP-ribose) glycohydrolase ARH3
MVLKRIQMKPTDIESKFLGGMIGSALGDAVGELAFRYPQERLLHSALDRASLLRYTDDTAMAIGLAESIVEKKCIHEQHLGHRFRVNFEREPWRGYASGPPTIFYMVGEKGIPYSKAAKSLFRGQGSLGNGAAMRIVAVGLFFSDAPDLYDQACSSARVTHAHPVGMDGAAVQALAVAQAVTLDPREEFPLEAFIHKEIDMAGTPEIREKMELVEQLVHRDASPESAAYRIGRSVAVHESMPFALFSFLRHPYSFEKCISCAIMNGGDRDTLGAMAGAVSGAYLGIDAIPQSWKDKLENRTYLESLATDMARAKEGTSINE